MITYILLGIFVVVFVGNLCYWIVGLGSEAGIGRPVDVKVISCEHKNGVENGLYYETKVDFHGENGENLVKTMQSAKEYMPGDVIRCRYLEKRDLLFEEMTPEMRKQSRNSGLVFLVIFLIVAGLVAVVMVGGMPQGAERLFTYLISILFMGIGIFGIYGKIRMKQSMHDMISLPGMQMDYTIRRDRASVGHTILIYNPVYEYEWEGEKRRIVGPVGRSGKKYRTIGRKVHILVDPHTGEAVCREDEKTKGNLYFLFGIIGLAVFALLLAQRFGVIS